MKILALALTLLLSSVPAFAAGGHEHKACAPDRAKFCPGEKVGTGLVKCMNAHKAELSPDCQAMMVDEKAAMMDCKDDMKKFCADVKVGGGAKIHCLKSHVAEVSEACKKHMM